MSAIESLVKAAKGGMVTHKNAEVSPDGRYRYWLTRTFAVGDDLVEYSDSTPIDADDRVCWVMLNPSTADANLDDPTIRRCMGFTYGWGYRSMVVVNLFALRATDPRELVTAEDPWGPDNGLYVDYWVTASKIVVAAWGGSYPKQRASTAEVALHDLRDAGAQCLGHTSKGDPRHPLYLGATTPLEPL